MSRTAVGDQLPIDPHAQRLLRMVSAGARSGTGPVTTEERRRSFASLMRLSSTPAEVGGVEERTCPGPGGALALRVYTPQGSGAECLAGLVYFHGGGLVAGSLDTHDALCRTLCNEIGCRLVAVDYRLAPEHPFPAAIEDALAALRWVLDHAEELGIDPARVAVGGDSAGATLAVIATQEMREAPGRQPCAQLLLCPVLDFVEERGSKRDFGEGFLLDKALMDRDLADYAPGVDLADPRISPFRALDLSGVPRAFIHTAEFDPLRDEGAAYAERLRAAQVKVAYTCHPGMVHHFYGLTGMIPAARSILVRIAAEIMAALRPEA